MKTKGKLIGVAALTAALLAGSATSAWAAGVVTWKNHATANCLGWEYDVIHGGYVGHPIAWNQSGSCTSGPEKFWDSPSTVTGNWYERIYDDAITNYCLVESGTSVNVEICKWTAAERFKEVHTGSGWELISEANGLAVTNSGGSIYLASPNGSANQYWT
jgi:hypothetical protein